MSASFDIPEDTHELNAEREAHAGTRARLKLLERSLLHFVPRDIIAFLGKTSLIDVELGDQIEKNMSVVFTDIRDFTSLSESMTPQQTFSMINSYLSVMNPVVSAHHGIIDKYMGDAIMALFPTAADDALASGLSMLARLDEYNAGRERAAYAPIRIGIGINTGVLMLGVIGGGNRMEGTVLGHTVNLASRLQTLTKTYGAPLLISEHTLYSLSEPEKFLVRHLGRVKVTYNTNAESIYEVFNHDAPKIREEKSRTLQKFEEALALYHTRSIDRAQPMLAEIVRDNPDDIPARVYLQRCTDYLSTGLYTGLEDPSDEAVRQSGVGHNEIDSHHQDLMRLIAALRHAVIHRHDTVNALIAKLTIQIEEHFDFEEQLMHTHHYPFAADHIAQHRSYKHFFEKLGNEIKTLTCDPWYTGYRIKLFLSDWLLNHTDRDDRHLGRFLHEHAMLDSQSDTQQN
ncbi:MAG: adenylate/guanylate cyclase domain-containing protein [Nitrosomonadales bacterium]